MTNVAIEKLIQNNVIEEFRRRLQGSRGYDAKRADARRFVYTTMVARMTSKWWNLNRKKLLEEMEEIETEMKQGKTGL